MHVLYNGGASDAEVKVALRLFDQASNFHITMDQGRDLLLRQKIRFVVTSIERGSIEIVGGILIAAGWAFKKFIEPGWERSGSKKAWDDAVASMVDRSVPILKEQIDFRVVHRLKRLMIKRISLRPPPSDKGLQLADHSTPDTELIYEKPKQIVHHPKKESPR